VARAVGGDIQRHLAQMQGIANLEVKRPERDEKEEKKRREEKSGTVKVPAPLRWGTFIIKADDGRVIVIDEDGEFDSGLVKPVADEDDKEKVREGKRWVKAASSVDTSFVRGNVNKVNELARRAGGTKKPKSNSNPPTSAHRRLKHSHRS
jgi:hypothetical protein